MNVTLARHPLADDLQGKLARFEQLFSYPLGPGMRFSISHRGDYLKFFRRMGHAECLVVQTEDRIVGVMTTVRRKVRLPGQQVAQEVLYLSDLKVSPGPDQGRAFFLLARLALSLYQDKWERAFGIVMHGTERTPELYTGGFGIPAFRALGQVAIVRLATEGAEFGSSREVPLEQVKRFSEQRSGTRASLSRVLCGLGSRMRPVGLTCHNRRASAIVEDTLDSKSLYTRESGELSSAHLSYFAYSCLSSGVDLVQAARAVCHRQGIPALFMALPWSELGAWQTVLQEQRATITGATLYGIGLPAGLDWNIHTSEV